MVEITPVASMRITRDICLAVYAKERAARKISRRDNFSSRCNVVRNALNAMLADAKTKAALSKISFKDAAGRIKATGRFRDISVDKIAAALRKSVVPLVKAKGWTLPADLADIKVNVSCNCGQLQDKIEQMMNAVVKANVSKIRFAPKDLVSVK
jgi:Arc/MetJ-type ribon-helix-helix transcriptional regulator